MFVNSHNFSATKAFTRSQKNFSHSHRGDANWSRAIEVRQCWIVLILLTTWRKVVSNHHWKKPSVRLNLISTWRRHFFDEHFGWNKTSSPNLYPLPTSAGLIGGSFSRTLLEQLAANNRYLTAWVAAPSHAPEMHGIFLWPDPPHKSKPINEALDDVVRPINQWHHQPQRRPWRLWNPNKKEPVTRSMQLVKPKSDAITCRVKSYKNERKTIKKEKVNKWTQ